MAYHADNTLISTRETLIELVTLPFRSFGRLIAFLAENNGYADRARAISEMTDEQLAAQGLTRADAVIKAFGRYM